MDDNIVIFCAGEKEPVDFMIARTFSADGPRIEIVRQNLQRILADDFADVIDVRGDGNCFIYACIVYLRETRDVNEFALIIQPFCGERDLAMLTYNPETFIRDATSMRHVAEQIRSEVFLKWDYKGECAYHMDEHAIDGLARNMVMRLLGIDQVVCYSIIPDAGESVIRRTIIYPDEKDLRPEISKWQVSLLSLSGYTHYCALFR